MVHIVLQERRVATTKKEKPSPFLKKFLSQSYPSIFEPEPKKAEVILIMV